MQSIFPLVIFVAFLSSLLSYRGKFKLTTRRKELNPLPEKRSPNKIFNKVKVASKPDPKLREKLSAIFLNGFPRWALITYTLRKFWHPITNLISFIVIFALKSTLQRIPLSPWV